MLKVIIVAVLSCLTACASVVEERAKPLIGKPVELALESWGPPVRETESNGITYMGWDFEYYRFKCKVHLVVQDGIVRRFDFLSDAEGCYHSVPPIKGVAWR